jgi:hypothetical protein
MKVKNVSARLHHVGNVSIAPGEEKEIPKAFENSINKNDLVEVKAVAPAPAAKPVAPKPGAPVSPVAPVAPAPAAE